MKLTILETSDVHGYLYPTDYQKKNQDLPLGLFKAASLIKKEQQEGEVVLVENGDFLQGSPLSHYVRKEKGEPNLLMAVLNHMQYDAGVIGNHEFNYGMDYLKNAVRFANHPVLAANILGKNGQPYFGPGYHILDKAGVKVAVLGLVTQYIPHWEHSDNYRGLTFQSAVECAKEYVPRLREEADVVIVSYHGGFEAELETGLPTEQLTGENEGYRLLKEVPGIDVLLTGHQHREIATVWNGIPVVQPGQKGENIAKITLTIEETENGKIITDKTAELLPTAHTEIDFSLRDRFLFLHHSVDKWLDQQIGLVNGDMRIHNLLKARTMEHPYIELVNRVQMHYADCTISGTALFNNTVRGFGKEITLRDIVTNYVYPNTLAVIRLSGAELKAVLERTAEYFTLDDAGHICVNPDFLHSKPQDYNYDMYEGIDYTIDVSKPIGERVVVLRYEDENVQPGDSFEVVMNHYRAAGGGDFDMLIGKEIIREVTIPMTELIAKYIEERQIIEAEANRNFQVVNGRHTALKAPALKVQTGRN